MQLFGSKLTNPTQFRHALAMANEQIASMARACPLSLIQLLNIRSFFYRNFWGMVWNKRNSIIHRAQLIEPSSSMIGKEWTWKSSPKRCTLFNYVQHQEPSIRRHTYMNREHLECHFLYGNCHWMQGLLSRSRFLSGTLGGIWKTLGKRMGRGSEVNDPPDGIPFKQVNAFTWTFSETFF